MILGTAKRLKTAGNNLNVCYKGQMINNVTEYKYLGNVVDQNLNFNKNFEKIYKKASGRLRLLKRLRYFLTVEAAYKIYTMMIVPLLTYRGPVKLTYTNTQQKRFLSLEHRAKTIVGCSIPGILNSIKKEALHIVKKSLDKNICTSFENYFKVHEHGLGTRNNGHLLVLPKFKLELGKQSFLYSGAKLFNDLPLTIRNSDCF